MNFYSLMTFIRLTAEESPIIVGGSSNAAKEAAGEVAGEVAAGGGLFGNDIFSVILMYAVLLGALYFFFFRPNKKRDKELKNMRESIRPGDNVVTTSGLYGKVTDVGEDAFIIEFGTNRGIRIPVSKSEVAGVKTPKLTPQPQIHEIPAEAEKDKGKEKFKLFKGKDEKKNEA